MERNSQIINNGRNVKTSKQGVFYRLAQCVTLLSLGSPSVLLSYRQARPVCYSPIARLAQCVTKRSTIFVWCERLSNAVVSSIFFTVITDIISRREHMSVCSRCTSAGLLGLRRKGSILSQ